MAKWLKALVACVLCAVVAVIGVLAGGILSSDKVEGASDGINTEFMAALTDMYRQYDSDYAKLDMDNPYVLKRLMVSGYNGNSYGAVSEAYDAENDFAVLQYSSEEAAKSAQMQLTAEGATAEPDALGELDATEKGTMYPTGSEMLGTTQYINHWQMGCDDVLVAVVDVGVMYDHVRLSGRFYNHGYDLSSDGNEDAYYDTDRVGSYFGHSTFISGIIADNTPDSVQIVPFKVVPFGEATNYSYSSVITAINQSVNMGVKVINLSLGGSPGASAYEKAINNAVKKGVCICCSAGNNAKELNDENKRYPSCIENAITVSAVDADKVFADYSNWGSSVDFTAPGSKIVSTYPGEDGTSVLYRWSGTSFSTPYIAALCADIKSLDNNMSFDDVYETLCDFAEDLGDKGRDAYYGNGIPYLGNMVYTDGSTYEYKIPQGTLEVYGSATYTQNTQPWRRYASKMRSVKVADSVDSIGDYMFCNMSNAVFDMPDTYYSVGDYAFYGCQNIKPLTFGIDVAGIGYKAFGNIEGYSLSGYRNTPAEEYALSEDIPFYALGCKHNYIFETVEPTDTEEGYTVYTCTVCGDSYIGPYIRPSTVASGVCGDTMRYRLYSNGMLLIYGSGEMYDYAGEDAPWSAYTTDIRVLNIYSGVASISPYAFRNCKNLGRITCHQENEYLKTDGMNLFSYDMSELLFTLAKGEYSLPQEVRTFKPQALLASSGIRLLSNEYITVKDGIAYDANGNILAALSSYSDTTLVIKDNIHIQDNAFMLTRYPSVLEAYCTNLTIGDNGIGYYYDGRKMVKENLTVKTLKDTPAADYATQNGFRLITDNINLCGEDIIWTYDSKTRKLTLYGSGAMYPYASAAEVPWYSVMAGLKEVVISDGITELSAYAFNKSSALEALTMPVSLKAPTNKTVWESCTSLQRLNMTLGSGRSDDYLSESGEEYYQFTPWYLSRNSITDFQLDENVRYIGKQMFRAFYGVKALTLRQVEEIGDEAFLACAYLKEVTVYPKDTVFGAHALFYYKLGSTYGNYKNTKLYGYIHSTAQQYAEENSIEFIPLDVLTGSVKTKDDAPLAGLQIYLDDQYIATTQENGEFVSDGEIENGYYTLYVKVHGAVIFESPLTVSDEQIKAVIKLRYADFVKDNVINAKDFAFALQRGYDDSELFDYGKIASGDNVIRIHKEKI